MEEIVKEAGDDMNEYKGNQDVDWDDEGDEIKQVDGIEKEMFNQDQDKVEIDTPVKPTILQIINSMQENYIILRLKHFQRCATSNVIDSTCLYISNVLQ